MGGALLHDEAIFLLLLARHNPQFESEELRQLPTPNVRMYPQMFGVSDLMHDVGDGLTGVFRASTATID